MPRLKQITGEKSAGVEKQAVRRLEADDRAEKIDKPAFERVN
jgi:hypothetical protein